MGLLQLFLVVCIFCACSVQGFGVDPALRISVLDELTAGDGFDGVSQVQGFHRESRAFRFQAVTAKLHHHRRRFLTAEFEVEGRVEFIRQGPLLPYDTHLLLHQWLLINVRCANALVRPGRSQLYVLTGSVHPDGTLAIARLFPWHKKDANIAVATRKRKHHRC